ncbi:hypothetical protein [Actinokineospora spheciospongiae]|uniref:hypothetical protein n=1 Tax=Actinokineospora spheciospongiae TaxID=909613 RepID=UPI00068C2E3F|nr:hypothetical protein [Actinokineospora spheciospongiae]PWW53645.1 hypothetical protein DFQ13_11528 [Actinokineospora spheciospongiae]
MTAPTGPRALPRVRAVRQVAARTLLLLVACAAVAAVSGLSSSTASAALSGLTARATGTVSPLREGVVLARWEVDGRAVSAEVEIAVRAPTGTTPANIAYSPTDPTRAVVPGATLLATADRAASGVVFAALVAALAVLFDLWLLLSRLHSARGPGRPLVVRRVRVQRGLLARSWLETESGPDRWIPVHFDPALLTLPTPTEVTATGGRWSTVRLPTGETLHPSGPTRTTEPRGRRTDNATAPDPAAAPRWTRQWRVDAAAAVPAPVVGLFWSHLDGSGFPGWLAATTITAAVAVWLWSVRGSDPS